MSNYYEPKNPKPPLEHEKPPTTGQQGRRQPQPAPPPPNSQRPNQRQAAPQPNRQQAGAQQNRHNQQPPLHGNQPRHDNEPRGPMSSAELGRQIGDGLHDVVHYGDFSRLSRAGQSIGEVARGLGAEIKNQTDAAFRNPQSPQGNMRQPVPPPPMRNSARNRNRGRAQGGMRPMRYTNTGSSAMNRKRNYAGVGDIIGGSFGVLFFAMMSIPALYVGSQIGFLITGILTLSSVVSIFQGISKHGFAGRLNKYMALLEQKNVLTFAEIAQQSGLPEAQVRKDVKKGLRKRKMPYVFLDKTGEMLMLGENTYNLYLQSEDLKKQKALEEEEMAKQMENPAFAEMEKFSAESNAILQKIQLVNDAIPGEEVSDKIDILKNTCSKIFSYVQAKPEKLPDIRKFMNYYLPTTLKMLDKYKEYEEKEIQSPSIQASRQEIEQGLDTINVAFNNLLDELYQEDTMDISTDIEVLRTMLEQEGLTGKKFDITASGEYSAAEDDYKEE